jgi:hypothetical protein
MRKLEAYILFLAISLWIVFEFTSCTTIPVTPAPETKPSNPIQNSKCVSGAGEWDACYEQMIKDHLTETMKKADLTGYCGDWVTFIKGVIDAESGFDASQEYKESFIDDGCPGYNQKSISTGWLQLSKGDACVYKTPTAKLVNSTDDLKNPEINLLFGMEIMDAILQKNNTPKALGAYWSTIRDKKFECKK